MWKGNSIPIAALVLLFVAVAYLILISGQPRMADGGLTGEEMHAGEFLLAVLVPLSVFATMFIAARRAWLARSWFWFIACIFAWPVSILYALLVNKGPEA